MIMERRTRMGEGGVSVMWLLILVWKDFVPLRTVGPETGAATELAETRVEKYNPSG